MDRRKLLELQTKRGAKTAGLDADRKTLEAVITECRKRIEERSNEYRDLDSYNKNDVIKNIIVDYVMANKPMVEGFIDDENKPDTLKLMNKLVDDITNYGILTEAMLNDKIYEIRSNGKEIKVEVEGHTQDLYDKEGNIVSFSSVEQQEIILRKFLGDVRLTPKDSIVNARTIEGYRIAAVHSSATSPDPQNPTGDRYHTFVLRKFFKIKMSLGDIVRKATIPNNMAKLLALMPAGGLTFFTVGATGSGKTVLNNAILQSVPPTTRTILLQNPSEIDLRFKDNTGRVYNDVVHLEAKEIEFPSPNDPTMENLMNHILRLSPTFVTLGEIRSNEEFNLALKISLAGHSFSTTFHSDSSYDAISRFLTAYQAVATNIPAYLALSTITTVVDLIVVEKKLRDGTRKVIQISEVVGVDPNDNTKPLLNDIYTFDIDGEPDYDDEGNVVSIHGHHHRVGKLSSRLVRKFQLEGIESSKYEFLLSDPNVAEVETYTGANV